MTTLYIIGNGFDLWHRLPTNYTQFYDFAKDTLDELAEFFVLDIAGGQPWSDFENHLGNFRWESFYEFHNALDVTHEDFRRSDVYGLEDELNEQADLHVSSIRDAFREWVSEIDVSQARKLMTFPDGASFINFNYTSTLQAVYGIDDAQVCHIHGSADRFDELIFGHGLTMEVEPELDENGDSNRTMFTDAENAAKYPFFALQKPVAEILKAKQANLSAARTCHEIMVIGHSLNDIDLPYFESIASSARDAQWTVCCFKNEDRAHHVRQLVRCGVQQDRISICRYGDLLDSF